MAMPDQDRAAMAAPLLPRPAFLSSSSFSISSFGSSSSSSFSDAASASSTAGASPMMPRGPCKALTVLRDHPGSVSCLSLCGEFLLSASTGADIVAWQQPDLRCFARFGHGEGSVKALAAAGGRVFSAHQDGRVRVWRVSRRSENAFKLVAALPTARDYLGRIFRQGSYVQTRRNHRRLWIEHADSISCLAVHDGVVYSGSWDKTLKVWRISDLKCLESIRAHDDAVNAVAADGGVIYSASADGRVKAWEKGKASHYLHGVLIARDGVSWNAIAVSIDRRVYAAGSDGHVVGWDRLRSRAAARWSLACDVKAHEMAVLCLCVVGDLLCTGSADKTIGLWRWQSSGEITKVGAIRGHEGPVKCLQASWCRVSNGCMVYSGSLDKSIRVWWVPNGLEGNEQQQDKCFKDQNQNEKACVFLR
ncbi:protein JINGUBANG-like [Phragmites australis]|uniref:protein JINGUBANG-like n=1 Tax=Phragmites australis TaxID=29695 RepID=UPI002D790387|nr:protein JINGUBANG-like [Phragmites australis]